MSSDSPIPPSSAPRTSMADESIDPHVVDEVDQVPEEDAHLSTTSEPPLTTSATIDFATPVWSRASTLAPVAVIQTYDPDQKLVLHDSDAGYTVWTEYDDECNVQVPADAFVPCTQQRSRGFSTGVPAELPARPTGRRGSLAAKAEVYYQKAKHWSSKNTRPKWFQRTFEYSCYALLLALIYFFLIGKPLWVGAIHGFWIITHEALALEAGTAIFWGVAAFYAISPLCCFFQPSPVFDEEFKAANYEKAKETCLLIPCYKSEAAIAATLEAALKIFPPTNIFVLDNGNSPTPFDNTQNICKKFGVRYFWISTGSKIVAQFIGCQAAAEFPYALLIDDDCTLPEDFPLRTERIQLGTKKRLVKCLGYAIASVGSGGSPGTLCQQAQDLEYKLSGMGRYFFGSWGSASFPHGAIALWDREFLSVCFRKHPGFTISEDWFFGHVARELGGRIQMCNEIFVKTETPPALMRSSKQGARAGYGEMTVVSQRMTRWNFFFVSRIWHNTIYILFSWNLGFYELSTKIVVFQEVYESLLMMCFPVVTPILMATQPLFTTYITLSVIGMYILTVAIFNEVHLRRKNAQVSRKVVYLYYPVYKSFLRLVNVWSTYRAAYMYARYFRSKHPTIYQNEKAMENLVRLIDQDHLGVLREANVVNIQV